MNAKTRVLLVDDQQGVLDMLSLVFEREGFEVFTAYNGDQALEQANKLSPDIIILDVMMPGISGIDVARELRSHPGTAQIPIIMLSAKGEVEDKVQGFEAGADDYVAKPVARQELLARTKALLQRAHYSQTPTAQVAAFVGAKGGVGTTTVAINVAAALVNKEKTVTLVELQAHPGTLLHHLNMVLSQDLGDLLALEPSELSWREVNRRVVQHSSGLRLLTAPEDAAESHLSAAHARAIIDALLLRTDYLLLDLPTVAGETYRQVLERTDHIFLVTEPELLSITAARARLQTLRDWSLIDRMRLVVLSRSPSAISMRREEVEKELGIGQGTGIAGVVATIPPSPEAFQQSSQLGIPVVVGKPHILSARALAELANWLTQHVYDVTTVS